MYISYGGNYNKYVHVCVSKFSDMTWLASIVYTKLCLEVQFIECFLPYLGCDIGVRSDINQQFFYAS